MYAEVEDDWLLLRLCCYCVEGRAQRKNAMHANTYDTGSETRIDGWGGFHDASSSGCLEDRDPF